MVRAAPGLHARPAGSLYLSASGLHIHEAAESALCFGGSVITPVTGGSSGSSPSATVRSTLGSLDLVWEPGTSYRLQASLGGGRIDDAVDTFDREIVWFMVEPSWTFAPKWTATVRYSGAGTFSDDEGFSFEGRPYANGSSYGFDLSSLQRLQLGLGLQLAPGLVAKAELGWDRLMAIEGSGLRDDTRMFTAAELVLTF